MFILALLPKNIHYIEIIELKMYVKYHVSNSYPPTFLIILLLG